MCKIILQPREASSIAMAWPMPLAAPVTTATKGGSLLGIGSVRSFVGRWLVIEFLPLDGLVHRFDAQDQQAVLEYSDGSAGLAYDDGDRLGALRDGCSGPVARAQAFGELKIFVEDFDDLSGAFDDSIGRDDESTVHLSDFFDVFSDPSVMEIAMFTAVSFEGVETAILAVREDFAGIPDDEQSAYFIAFAAFATDLDGQVDDDFEVVQRYGCFESLQIAAGETPHAFIEFDDRDRVHAVGFETAVNCDHFALAR